MNKRLATLALSLASASLPLCADQTIDIRVLSYNINGLPPPLKSVQTSSYERIAELLRERRLLGTQPQIVVIQEAFDGRTHVIAEEGGYPFVVRGPGRTETSKRGDVHWAMKARKTYSNFPDPQKFTGSGLMILSDFPIVEARHKSFNSDECAGIDCLSNKSILLARVQLPTMKEPLDIITSHFNSMGSAAAPHKLVAKAHRKQTDVFSWFLEQTNVGNPLIAAGDFNTRSPSRLAYFQENVNILDTAEACIEVLVCQIAKGLQPAQVWTDTNDKQFYRNGKNINIVPLYIDRTFDETLNGRPLSDHEGYEVVYRVSFTETPALAGYAQ